MKHLILLNDPPYGTERSFNGLRMAHALAKNDPDADITVFLMAYRRRSTRNRCRGKRSVHGLAARCLGGDRRQQRCLAAASCNDCLSRHEVPMAGARWRRRFRSRWHD